MNQMCLINDGIEDTVHILLLCPSVDTHRCDLRAEVSELLRLFPQINEHSNKPTVQLLLYGYKDLLCEINKIILELTPNFILKTGWFN